VLINCPSYPHSISSDNLAGARQAVEHLVQLGHRQIAYIADPHSHGANLDRLTGYRSVLDRHQILIEPGWIVEATVRWPGTAGRAAVIGFSPPADRDLCFNDLTAIAALNTLSQAGVRVPADCSVIGFDDLELASFCCPPLTTVRQHRDQLGSSRADASQIDPGPVRGAAGNLAGRVGRPQDQRTAPAVADSREEVIEF